MEQDTVITVKSNTCIIKKTKIEYIDRVRRMVTSLLRYKSIRLKM